MGTSTRATRAREERRRGGHSPFAPSQLLVLPQLVQGCGVELPPNAALSSLTRQNPAVPPCNKPTTNLLPLQVKDVKLSGFKGCWKIFQLCG